MSFAVLSGLWLSLVALPVIALYVLKIKRHRRTVPYLKLWADLVGERRFNTLFQRLQRLLSLLMQLLIALCLVFAFASLTLSDSFLKEESVVLVIDTSASMNGREKPGEARTRIEAAVQVASDLIEGRSPEDEFAVIAAGPQPEVLRGFSRSTLRLREALDALRPTNAVGDLDGAVRLARDLLQAKKEPRILLIGDAAFGRAAALAAESEHTRWLRVGESVPNVAIRRFQVRKNFALGTDYLLLVVANESDEPGNVDVEVRLGDRLRLVVPLELGPREVRNVSRDLTGSLPNGGFAKAVIVHPAPESENGAAGDGLALDDVAFAAVQPSRAYRVLLVARDEAEEEPFRAALDALDTLVDREATAAARPELFARMTDEQIATYDLVLFVNWAPKSLPQFGRFFAIDALPGGLPAELAGLERSPRFREVDPDHPLNRFLETKSIHPAEARPLDLTGGEVFMSTAGGPVGVVFVTPGRKVVYLGLDVLSDLFFLQVAFPLELRNALAWMHEETAELLEPTYRPGEVVRPRFAVADARVEVGWDHEWEAGTAARGTTELEVRDGRFYFDETDEPGRYWVRIAEGDYRTAVNLFAAEESDLSMPPAAEADGDPGLERAGFLFGRDLWPLLLLVAAGLWLLEWALFHRRITQ